MHRIDPQELFQAQAALFVAIALQALVWKINGALLVGPQYLILAVELLLAVLISFTVNIQRAHRRGVHHALVIGLLGLLTAANVTSLVLVLQTLVVGHAAITGSELLGGAIAIFMTNIIVFSLWYWEIDSPGLTRKRWSKHDKDFHFTQQELKADFPTWKPIFLDYLYVSVTNAINFAPSDARPLTYTAKILMGSQALVSVFTLALVIARSVSILG